jgi:pimeloyl-ACP methyl ester carboxylesterase
MQTIKDHDMNRRFISMAAVAFATSIIAFAAQAAEVKNIVIVHGALADGSGWRKATEILVDRGFNVTIVQEPITSLADDVAATNRVLDLQDGPSLLVGHSYGGMVITEAGNNPHVAGLVYVAAFQPEKGESLFDLASSKPAGGMNIRETKDGKYLYLDPAAFADDTAGDLPKNDADFLARSQVFAAKQAFAAKIGEPAWKTRKSWTVVATHDRSINPDLERDMARRSGSNVTEIAASHAIFASQPEKVADVIEKAAKALSH